MTRGTTAPIASVIMVFGRGVLRDGDRYANTAAGAARVRAAAAYLAAHRADYRDRRPRLVFSGGWPEASAGQDAPPVGSREGDLMLAEARAAGLDRWADLRAETRSRSTLENLLRTAEDGLLAGGEFSAASPLGIVSHAWHLPRVRYLAAKVLGLRGARLLDIPAEGGELPAAPRTERTLLLAARLGFLGARRPAALLRRERLLVAAARLAGGPPHLPGNPSRG